MNKLRHTLATTPLIVSAFSQNSRIEAAKDLFNENPLKLAINIGKLGITNQDLLTEFATKLAETDPYACSWYIGNFGIKDEATRVGIAKRLAEICPYSCAVYIRNFRIEDEATRVSIAKRLASSGDLQISRCIKQFDISGEDSRVEIAKIEAAAHGSNMAIQYYGITKQAALDEIAAIVAQTISRTDPESNKTVGNQDSNIPLSEILPYQRPSLLVRLRHYGTSALQELAITPLTSLALPQACKIEVIKQIVKESPPWRLGVNIGKLGITSQSELIEIAMALAETSPALCSHSIMNFGIKDEVARIAIAKKCLSSGDIDHVSAHIRSYGITDEAARLEIAKLAARSDREGVSTHIKDYEITDEDSRIQVAKIAAASCGCKGFIQDYGITNQIALVEIAHIAATAKEDWLSENIGSFGIKDGKDRIAVAQLLADRELSSLARFIKNFEISNGTIRHELARKVAIQDRTGFLSNFTKWEISDPSSRSDLAILVGIESLRELPSLHNFGLTSSQYREYLLHPLFEKLRASCGPSSRLGTFITLSEELKALCQRPDCPGFLLTLAEEKWEEAEPHERLGWLGQWLVENAGLNSAVLDYQKEVQAEELIYGALAAGILLPEEEQGAYFTRSRAALGWLSGYDLPKGELSPNSTRDLWGTVLTASQLMGECPGLILPLDFGKDRVRSLKLLQGASALVGLGGAIPADVHSADDLGGSLVAIEEALDRQFGQLFRLDGRVGKGSVFALQQRWGDLTPLLVLTSRLQSQGFWKQELPVVRDVITQVLDGTFHQRRYGTRDGQIGFLSRDALRRWQNNPSSLELHLAVDQKVTSHEETRVNLVNIFKTNILAHCPQELLHRSRDFELDELQGFLRLNDAEQSKILRDTGTAVSYLRTAIMHGTSDELRTLTSVLNNNKAAFLKDIADIGIRKQLSQDITSLKESACGKRQSQSDHYVFSVITDDPSLLLRTGDLVQAASCQNYRYGAHVDTLPGYVIDANIKLALSFVLKRKVLDDAVEKLRLKEDETFKVTFDAPRQTLILCSSNDPENSIDIPLGYALRREILRLGSTGNRRPVLVAERAYIQVHSIQSAIRVQQDALIEAFRRNVGASAPENLGKVSTSVYFPQSRNPGGVYSDIGEGVMHGSYAVAARNAFRSRLG